MTEPHRPAHDGTTQLYPQGSPESPGNESSSAVSQSTWESEANAAEVVRVLDQVMSDRQAGREISREALLAAHPQIADQLAACLAGLEFLHPPGSVSEASKTRTIGDFRLGREVGRGGMGAVYEAEQISLARRVALKILRFGPVSDHDAIDRFRREAETVATLHHTNIVPIFYVGNEQGVNYYAMQFIDGRDLAQVIADATAEIASKQVAEWGLQAAEALAHAHKRGVIHRDVKPSNLILDRDGRVWLTDFGLARRLDDVTLSLTGMLLGTPRYMSPEHARASTRRIDHRSDLFSLGATLYELLARRPAFAGDTAHDVIQHILSDDPVPLRQFNPHIDRDLETVVMKCLAKEPDERYASAEELAADLRAILEERPIRARRAGLVEQSWRWVKKNRRSVSQVATAVAATLLVSVAAVFSRSAYVAWHEASVLVETDDLGAVAEFLDSGDRSVARETLPMQTASKLSTGDYKLRVTAERTLSQSFDIMLDIDSSGARRKANVSDRWLQPPVLIGDFYDHCDLGLQKVVVGWNRDGLSLRNMNGNLDKRSIPIEPGKTPEFEAFPGFQLPTRQRSVTATGYGEDASARPWLLNGPMDVNGDGIGDLIVAGRHQAWVLAVSGDGSGVLWIAGMADELKKTKTNPGPDSNLVSAVLYPPQRIDDADGDSRDDLIVVWMEISERTAQSGVGAVSSNRRIGVISSSTGKPIREITLPDSAFALPQNVSAPRDLSIPVGWMGGRSMHGGHNMHVGNFRIRSPAVFEQTGPHTYVPTDVHFVHDAMRSKVPVVIVGDRLVQLDFTEPNSTGKVWKQEWTLDFRPGKDVEWYDVDGDGIDELIALAERPSGVNPTDPPEPTLHVWSLLNGKSLWSKPLDTYWSHKSLTRYDHRTPPRVIDLDGDGKLEIVFGDGRSHGPKWFSGGSGAALLPRGTIAAVRALDGEPLWSTSVATIDADIDRFVIGDDINGDSVRDVFTVTVDPKGMDICVDAISGTNGEILRTTSQRIVHDAFVGNIRAAKIGWWNAGEDGWPQLMVSVVDFLDAASDRRAARVIGFSAGTGSVTTTGSAIADFEPVDLDNDSVDDLIVVSRTSNNDDTGSLVAIRGVKRQLWKRLGETGEAAGDFDSDGVLDLVRSLGDGTLIAVSGATGRQLWNSRYLPAVSTWRIFPISHRTERIDGDNGLSRDLNGDGCDDFLVATSNVSGMKRSPLAAVSGRDGRMLWSAKDCEGSMITGTSAAECRDLDGDGIKEVVWVCSINHDYPEAATVFSNQNVQLWMFATSTKDGRLLWSHALSPAYTGVAPPPMSMRFDGDNEGLPLTMVDLNRDGHLDVIAPAQTSDGLCMRAIDGKSGTVMWERERDSGLGNFGMGNSDGFHMWSAPAVVDFEGDGKSELVIWEPLRPIPNESKGNSTPQPEVAVTALDAQGRTLWTQSTGRPFSQFSPWGGYKENPNRMLALNVREPGDKKSDREQTKSREQTEYVVLFPERDGTVFVWDAKGNAADTNAIRKVDGSLPLVLDIDGGGSDELIVVDSARSDKQTSSAVASSSWRNAFEQDQVVVKCFRPDSLDRPVWISELGIGGSIGQSNNSELNPARPQELYVRTDAYGNHEVCIRCGPIGNCVYGLKPSDGTILWKCHGPISRVQQEANSYSTLNGVCLLDDSPGLPPVVCFQHANWTDCRIAAPTESYVQQYAKAPDQESTNNDLRLAVASSLNRVSAVSRPGSPDRRLLRRLPWNPEFAQDPRIVSFLAFGTMLSCCLVLGPIFCVIWLATRRPMELKHLFLVPVVAAVFLQAWWATPPSGHEFETGWLKAMTAFFFAPPLAAMMFVLWQIWFRRWPSLVRWTCVWLVCSLVISVLVLTISSHNSPMSQHENYDYSGWYWILVPGALVTAWIMLPVCGATWLIQSLNRRIRLREVAASRVP